MTPVPALDLTTKLQNFRSTVRILVGARHRRRRCRIVRTRVRTADQKLCSPLLYHGASAHSATVCSPHYLDPCLPLTKNPKLCVSV